MSAKTSTQPGRRTPLSLTGAVAKGQPNKSSNAANSGGSNVNGHSMSNNHKQDNKLLQHQQKTEQTVNNTDTKENPNKKHQHQQHADKKQLQQNDNNKKSVENTQNGINSKPHQANDNKEQEKQQQQQQCIKDKQQQNGNDNKLNEKDKKEKHVKHEKSEKSEKSEKVEKSDKEEIKVKDDKNQEQEIHDNKNEEKKLNDNKGDKKEADIKTNDKSAQQTKNDDKKSKEEKESKITEQKLEEKGGTTDDVVEQQQPKQRSTPITPKSNNKGFKPSTPGNKTPTNIIDKTPQKSSPSNDAVKTMHIINREVTTTIDDVEMEPLTVESSPVKSTKLEEVAHVNITPSATSTPGKILLPKRNLCDPKSDLQLAMQTGLSIERPLAFSQISGRKSIRPISDYTPSKFQSNLQFRESYRRINTELDATNTSMNVTVGSDVPNNSSFSFFGRGRKRDRTAQNSQSAIGELQTDMEISPPKKVRLDMQSLFSVMSSPLSLLRNRFSKATLQSSTPFKLQQKLNESEDEIEIQNVSGVSIHEEIAKSDKDSDSNSTVKDEESKENKEDNEINYFSLKCEKTCGMQQAFEQSDFKITETPLQTPLEDQMIKNKRCIVM